MDELITVCVTTYNRKDLIKKTIDAILKQSYKNIEIIIVDDCSEDNTEKYIKKYIIPLDNRIKYFKHHENKGLAAARNTAIYNAKGKYFTFCDDDDTWDKDFLLFFKNNIAHFGSDYSFCASKIATGNQIKGLRSSFKEFIILGYTPPVASQFYLTKDLIEIGGYDENIKSGVDHDLWLTLAYKNYNLIWLNKNLVSINQVISDNRITYNIEKRLVGIKNSLIIWNVRIGDKFGDSFFYHLRINYQYNTYKKFLLLAINNKKYLKALSYWMKLPKTLFISDVKRFLTKSKSKNFMIQPTFNKCSNDLRKSIYDIEMIKS